MKTTQIYFKQEILFSELLVAEQNLVFDDVSDDFSRISSILDKFEDWRKNDFTTYKDTYFSICLPKVILIASLSQNIIIMCV